MLRRIHKLMVRDIRKWTTILGRLVLAGDTMVLLPAHEEEKPTHTVAKVESSTPNFDAAVPLPS